MEINITLSSITDIPVIKEMAGVTFRHTYREILSKEQTEYMMEWMYSAVNLEKQFREGHIFYIAYSNGTPCGYMSLERERKTENGRAVYHLHKLYVMPGMQGNGVGELLFRKACSHIKENAESAVLELNVNRHNKALYFYRKMGMEIAREGDFAIGNGYYMNDYIMRMDID